MKYIPAEKLIAEIERLKKETPIGICEYDKGEENGRMEVLTSLQSTIASLQQEQSQIDDASKMGHAPNLEHWLAFFGMPEENIENCATQISQDYGAIRYLEGVQHGAEAVNELEQQEQPEVDLEKYISDKLFVLGADLINHKPYSFNRGLNVGMSKAYADILTILNARKEEIKP